jgi:malto-oligosyltrehalose trehalohydrolase
MVLLDVVYNHFGPDGNYLHAYAPQFFNAKHHTPWGAAINFDGEASRTVREFYVHNALYWLEEFHLDGLRMDAVHAIADDSAQHIVHEIAKAVREGPGADRNVHLILENERNEARRLAPAQRQPLADAQWNDDVHHALHVIATGENDGYYADFPTQGERSALWLFGRALAEGFAYQGEASAYREGRPHGEPSTVLSPLAFVAYTQTHDQVGNRAFGERLVHLADEARLRALTACVLLAPSVPMLFMGEEFGAPSPFLYFCDYQGDLARAVTEGRRSEFRRFARFADAQERASIPDPNGAATFERSKLDWSARRREPHAHWLAFYSRLLRLRREHIVPLLPDVSSGRFQLNGDGGLHVAWPIACREGERTLHLFARLQDEPAPVQALPGGHLLYASHPTVDPAPAWSVRVSLEHR